MEMKRLNATGLRAAGYDEKNRKLVVETTAGTYEYANVSPEIYRRLMTSPSPASYYRESIEEEFTGRRLVASDSPARPKPADLFD
jgi:hypothetical protein